MVVKSYNELILSIVYHLFKFSRDKELIQLKEQSQIHLQRLEISRQTIDECQTIINKLQDVVKRQQDFIKYQHEQHTKYINKQEELLGIMETLLQQPNHENPEAEIRNTIQELERTLEIVRTLQKPSQQPPGT